MTLLKKPKERDTKKRQIISLPTPTPEQLGDPAELFLHLTRWTCPHGSEAAYYGAMLSDLGFVPDGLGNYARTIGESATCFMCHLDTCDDEPEPITRFIEQGVCGTDGKTILGADDRAGLTVLLYLMHKQVPGTYYLFEGEEVGCIGSKKAAGAKKLPAGIKRAISFDRRGKTSVITKQCGSRCCSDEFAYEVANALNAYGMSYSPDSNGLFTDSLQFVADVPECTNLSVGYTSPHCNSEKQDLDFLAYLCEVCAEIDWEGFSTHRIPAPPETKRYSSRDWDDWDSGYQWWNEKNQRENIRRYGYDYSTKAANDDYDLNRTLEAMDRLADQFIANSGFNTADISKLVKKSTIDTIENLEILLETIHARIQWVRTSEDDDQPWEDR